MLCNIKAELKRRQKEEIMPDDNKYNEILNKLKSGENPTPTPKESTNVGTKPFTFGLKSINEGFEGWFNGEGEKKTDKG